MHVPHYLFTGKKTCSKIGHTDKRLQDMATRLGFSQGEAQKPGLSVVAGKSTSGSSSEDELDQSLREA